MGKRAYEKTGCNQQPVLLCSKLDGALHITRTQATSANILSHGSSVFNNPDSLHIGSPFPFGFFIRVGHVVAGDNALVADFAIFGHF